MKKITVLTLALLLILSLSACKKAVPAATDTAPAATETAAAALSTSGAVSAAPEAEPTPPTEAEQPWTEPAVAQPTEPEADHLHPFLLTDTRGYLHPETYDQVISMVTTKVRLPEEEEARYPELARAFADYNKELTDQADTSWQELYRIFTAMLEDKSWETFGNDGVLLSQEDYAACVRADSAVVSFLTSGYSWWGGAHGDYYFSGVNFDTETGKRLALTDIVKDTDAFARLVDKDIRKQLPEDYNDLFEKPYDYLKGIDLSEPGAVGFTVDNEGVTLYFSPYAIGWFALGAQKSKVYFADAPELFREKYAKGTKNYVLPVIEYFPETVDVDGDGTREPVNVVPRISDDENDMVVYDIICGSRTKTMEEAGYSEDSFLVCVDGTYYLYVFLRVENDYTLFRVLDLRTMEYLEDEAELCSFGLGFDRALYSSSENTDLTWRSYWPEPQFTDPGTFTLEEWTDLLSTITGNRTYHTGPDGVPVPESEWCDISGNTVILVREDVTCEKVSPDGTKEKDVILAAGTALRFLRTDKETYVDVQTVERSMVTFFGEDDWKYYYVEEMPAPDLTAPIYRIAVDTSDWPRKVNGRDFMEMLEGMQFAG